MSMSQANPPNDHPSVSLNGLTVVVNPENPSLDVIFVHGFTGHPERTWTHKKGDVSHRSHDEEHPPPSKIQKIGRFTKQRRESSHAPVFWPRDLLPTTVPNARVLTYGYDTHIRHKLGPSGSQNSVYDIAGDFLVALEAGRRDDPSRPTIFIAHSLGGIIVKEMLRRSSQCHRNRTHLKSVSDATVGIVFFGTPHRGADPRGILQRIAEKAIKAAGFSVNEQIVNALLPSSERLKELRDEFEPLAQKQNWIIHSFQEQVGVKLLDGLKVVEDSSSYLNIPAIEITEHIARNHMDICRFTGLDDSEYCKLASALVRITKTISPNLETNHPTFLSEGQILMLLESLRFDQIDTRHMSIRKAHSKTCKWLLKHQTYHDWLDASKQREHHGLLWIRGKPGTGKSTLMKFALANARKSKDKRVFISFFFNARGEELEKSTLGMYQSLLLQLLERLPEHRSVFETLGLATSTIDESRKWTIESLKSLLEQVIQRLGKTAVVCFIDALDECDDFEIRDMISFLENIGEMTSSSGVEFQVCLSSRHYPHITIRKGLHLKLETQEGHGYDIIDYLDSELKIGHGKLAEQIRSEVQSKASGVFMWVVLVVEILNKEYDGGRLHAIRRKLSEIPGDLHELFRDILTRDHQNRDEMLLCLQWILFAKRPLKPEELYFAILSENEHYMGDLDLDSITSSVIDRFVVNSSKGLAEITKSAKPTAQFIHESVKDFLLKTDGLGEIWPNLADNFRGQSHDKLKKCCLNYQRDSIKNASHDFWTDNMSHNDWLDRTNSEVDHCRKVISHAFPFMEYAIRCVFYHSNLAGEAGVSQKLFVSEFDDADRETWIELDSVFEKKKKDRHRTNTSLLYFFAQHNLPSLAEAYESLQTSIPASLPCSLADTDELYRSPFSVALAYRNYAVTNIFLNFYATLLPSNSQYRHLWLSRGEGRNLEEKSKIIYEDRWATLSHLARLGDPVVFGFVLEVKEFFNQVVPYTDLLKLAVDAGHKDIVEIILSKEEVDVNAVDSMGDTLLLYASTGPHTGVVQLLLKEDTVDVNAKNQRGRTPIAVAAMNQNADIVQLLLQKEEIDVNMKDRSCDTPLHYAADRGNTKIVQILLQIASLDINAKNHKGCTPLIKAVKRGSTDIAQLLLEKAVNFNVLSQRAAFINATDDHGCTPLYYATETANIEIVRLLLNYDSTEPDIVNQSGRTPLSYAAKYGYRTIVQLLLATGRVRVNLEQENGSKSKEIRQGKRPLKSITSPLYEAVQSGDCRLVELLLNHEKSSIHAVYWPGITLLYLATRNIHLSVAKLIYERDPEQVDIESNLGETPLIYAARRGRYSNVKFLLESNMVRIDHKARDGRTALSWALLGGDKSLCDLLRAHGATDD